MGSPQDKQLFGPAREGHRLRLCRKPHRLHDCLSHRFHQGCVSNLGALLAIVFFFFLFCFGGGGGAAEPTCEVRLQTGRTALPSPEEGGPLALFDGLLLNLGREAGFTAGLWEAAQILICGEHAALPRLESLLLKLKAPNASILLGTFNFLKRAIFNLLLQWLAGNVESFEGQRDQELRPLL